MKYLKITIIVLVLTISLKTARAVSAGLTVNSKFLQVRLPPPPPHPPLPFQGHRRHHRHYRHHHRLHINLHLPPPPPHPPHP